MCLWLCQWWVNITCLQPTRDLFVSFACLFFQIKRENVNFSSLSMSMFWRLTSVKIVKRMANMTTKRNYKWTGKSSMWTRNISSLRWIAQNMTKKLQNWMNWNDNDSIGAHTHKVSRNSCLTRQNATAQHRIVVFGDYLRETRHNKRWTSPEYRMLSKRIRRNVKTKIGKRWREKFCREVLLLMGVYCVHVHRHIASFIHAIDWLLMMYSVCM